jgi:hypothetical protein
MPFAIIAVLILVLSSTSIVLIYGVQFGHDYVPQKVMIELRRSLGTGSEQVKGIAYSAALTTISAVDDLNESDLSTAFRENLNDALRCAFPTDEGGVRVDVDASDVQLVFLRASLQESYARYGEDVSEWQGASLPTYFTLRGNYSVNASAAQGSLSKTYSLDQDIYVPIPLLLERLERISAAADPRGELESIVRYELSALAQHRVLSGYGMTSKTGDGGTAEIITADDVQRAFDLALVLIELRYVGSADADGLSEFPGLAELAGDSGTLDPADLFLRSYEVGGLDLAPLVAQAIYRMADVIVLRWLDYFGMIDILNWGEDIYESLSWGVTDVLDILTQGDTAQYDALRYIWLTMYQAGVNEYDYRFMNYGYPDVTIQLPEHRMVVINDNDEQVSYTFGGSHYYEVDFPSVDLFASPAWGEFYREYKTSTHELAYQLKAYVEAVAYGVASYCTFPAIDLDLDPTDSGSYLSSLDAQLAAAFIDRPLWLKPSLDHAWQITSIRDGLAQAASEFVDGHWEELFDMSGAVDKAVKDLTEELFAEVNGTPNFSPSTLEVIKNRIEGELRSDDWAGTLLRQTFEDRAAPFVEKLETALSNKNSTMNPLVYPLSLGLTLVPGLEQVVSTCMLGIVAETDFAVSAQGGPVALPAQDGLDLTLSEGQVRHEDIAATSSSRLEVTVTQPWEYDRGQSTYPNRHVTDIMNLTSMPFLTQWGVSYQGSFDLTLGSSSSAQAWRSSAVEVESTFVVITHTAWGLQGVLYAPTATLLQDVQEFLEKVWDFLTTAASTMGNLAYQAFSIFAQFATALAQMATQPISILADLITKAVDALKDALSGVLGGVLKAIADLTASICGDTTINISLLGMSLVLAVEPEDSMLPGSTDRLRMDLSMSCLGATVRSSLRVLQMADGSHALVGEVELGGGDWHVSVVVDPLQSVYGHQAEVQGYLGGTVIELRMPEVEMNQKVTVSLQDVPGLGTLLDNIPSPVPGTKVGLDGGVELQVNMLNGDEVLINEVELNPPGKDASREWVELYNPTDRPVDLSGWSLATSRGMTSRDYLSGMIPAHGFLVHTFSGQALDNGADKGFPLQDSVVLLDADSRRIDSAPWLQDLADDQRSWQRSYDSSPTWEFRDATKGTTNGLVLIQAAVLDGLSPMIQECFEHALARQRMAVPDLTTLNQIFNDALDEMVGRLLDSIGETISSVEWFLQIELKDATGAVGAGIVVALLFDGTAVRESFGWVLGVIGSMLRDPLNPMAAVQRAVPPVAALLEHTFVRFGAYVKAGAPDILLNGPLSLSIKAMAEVRVNLATLCSLPGYDAQWEVDFGLVFSGIPASKLKVVPGISASATADVWLLRGTVRAA